MLNGLDKKTVPRKKPKRNAADVKKIKALEKEVKRKDKALAETAALLVLKKKKPSKSGGTRTTTQTRGTDDGSWVD